MYNLMKSVIKNGGYKLADIQYKAKKLYVVGDITEEQLDEIMRLASGGVSAEAERPENLRLIQTLAEKLEALKARVTVLEGGEEPEKPEYPAWKPWDGISKDYQRGDIVSHNGKLWESIFDGQNVWEPGTAGTDALWGEVTA